MVEVESNRSWKARNLGGAATPLAELTNVAPQTIKHSSWELEGSQCYLIANVISSNKLITKNLSILQL